MFERIVNFALYGDTDKESYNSVKDKIENSNRKTALVFASVAAVLIGVMFILSFSQEGFSSSKPIYIAGMIFSLLLIVIALLAKRYRVLSYVSVHMSVMVFMLYGIAIATLSRPDQQTVTFMVMLIFVPLIFVDRPIRMALVLCVYITLFIVLAFATKTDPVLSVDVTDAVIFGLLAIVSEAIIYRIKIRSFVLERKLKLMSDSDRLTGLNNRNCYERRLGTYPALYKSSISCVYVDVNGLHELNNKSGHKSGDEMLRTIADEVKDTFGERDTYRIGGDEYVAFAIDITVEELEAKLSGLKEKIAAHGYHAAVGYERRDIGGVDMNELIVAAETNMYKDKSDYYKAHDRRVRR